jgi:hypothetical protein
MTGRFFPVHFLAPFAMAALLTGVPGPGSAQLGAAGAVALDAGDAAPASAADSTRIHREARRAQEEFERFRVSQTPARPPRPAAAQLCWDQVGPYCLRGGGSSLEPVPVPRAIIEARRQLVELLEGWAASIPGDGWITGQRVRYLLEGGEHLWASQVADDCLADASWCDLLRGWVEHERGSWVESGRFFLDAIEAMTLEERRALEVERWLTDRAAQGFLFVDDPAERERRRALLWRLSDPLYLVPGNARWSAHMTRFTRSLVLADSENHLLKPWNESLQQLEVRYGLDVRLERERQPVSLRRPNIEDPDITGWLAPSSHEYLPPGAALASFPETSEGALVVRGVRSTTGYTAPFARTFENLTSQTGRFLRGGELFIVHAFAPALGTSGDVADDEERPFDPFDPLGARGGAVAEDDRDELLPRDLRTALFLLPVDGPVIEEGPRPAVEGAGIEGVWTATAPRGDLILSLEAWSRFESRAWRVRHGLPDLPETGGTIAASDPILLDAEPVEEPASLEEAMEHMLATTRLRSGDRIRIGWEVYGIPEGEIASVSLGLEEAERSMIRRIGEFFRVLEPTEPATIRWDDAEAERPGTVFRTIDLQLPLLLSPGSYDLILEIRLGDEPPAVARRRFHIDP